MKKSDSLRYHCITCHALVVEYKHGFNKGLAVGLHRISLHTGPTHVRALGLSYTERDNFQKLRYWSLVTKAERPDGTRIGGFWAITHRGRLFVAGEIMIPKSVWTYRGEFVRYDIEDGNTAFSSHHDPRFKTRPEYAAESVPHGGDLFQ